ncbi:MAG TPA: hypothetical protein EYP57_06015 [Thermodesulfobacteriaceae bacterium]|nr:hypothetical protein [Thermodesulfobacteriaceae bacterium]
MKETHTSKSDLTGNPDRLHGGPLPDVARLGIVNFINTAPICIPWQEMGPLEGWVVEEGPPTFLNMRLAEGRLDVGLVSSFAYGLDAERYFLLPDLGISATGPVGSVILFSRRPLRELHGKYVLLTPHSATSVNLLYIILENFLGIEPLYKTGRFQELESDPSTVAYLAIGDEALRLKASEKRLFQWDLAEIWLRNTGLPFVFAVWAVRKKSWNRISGRISALFRRLVTCYNTGRNDMARISRLVAPRIPMDPGQCLDYLEGIELDLSMEKQKGLLHFFSLLHERGGFPEVTELDILPALDEL